MTQGRHVKLAARGPHAGPLLTQLLFYPLGLFGFELTDLHKDIDLKGHLCRKTINLLNAARRQFFYLKISLCGPRVGLSLTCLT